MCRRPRLTELRPYRPFVANTAVLDTGRLTGEARSAAAVNSSRSVRRPGLSRWRAAESPTDKPDGSFTVRLHAAGLMHVVNHLMTRGPTVAILAPDEEITWEGVDALYEHCQKMRQKRCAARTAAE